MQNEWSEKKISIGHFKSRIVFSNFLTKPLSSAPLQLEESFDMGYVHLSRLSPNRYKLLTVCAKLSTSPRCVPCFAIVLSTGASNAM